MQKWKIIGRQIAPEAHIGGSSTESRRTWLGRGAGGAEAAVGAGARDCEQAKIISLTALLTASAAPVAFGWGYHCGGFSGGSYHGAYGGYHGAYYGGTAVVTPGYAGYGAAAAGAAVGVAATSAAYAAASTNYYPAPHYRPYAW